MKRVEWGILHEKGICVKGDGFSEKAVGELCKRSSGCVKGIVIV